jgi:Holliday junction resolvase RusA-like endonuclease
VAGVPQTQGSTKSFAVKFAKGPRAGKWGAVTTSDNSQLRLWRNAVTSQAQENAPGALPLQGVIALSLLFVLPRPAGHFGSGRNAGMLKASAPRAHTGSKADLDKLERAILDALADAGIFQNDGQVAAISAHKMYGPRPGCRIRLEHGADWKFGVFGDDPSTMAS